VGSAGVLVIVMFVTECRLHLVQFASAFERL
jgi:hypothetical protein